MRLHQNFRPGLFNRYHNNGGLALCADDLTEGTTVGTEDTETNQRFFQKTLFIQREAATPGRHMTAEARRSDSSASATSRKGEAMRD